MGHECDEKEMSFTMEHFMKEVTKKAYLPGNYIQSQRLWVFPYVSIKSKNPLLDKGKRVTFLKPSEIKYNTDFDRCVSQNNTKLIIYHLILVNDKLTIQYTNLRIIYHV